MKKGTEFHNDDVVVRWSSPCCWSLPRVDPKPLHIHDFFKLCILPYDESKFFSIKIIWHLFVPISQPVFPTVCSSQSIFITDDDMGADANPTIVFNLIVFDQILFLLIKVPFDSILATHYLKKTNLKECVRTG